MAHALVFLFRLDPAAELALLFSEKNLRSVVYNLLSNALKYRHPYRVLKMSIRCRPEGGYLVLEVQDNGLGLDLAQGQGKLLPCFSACTPTSKWRANSAKAPPSAYSS